MKNLILLFLVLSCSHHSIKKPAPKTTLVLIQGYHLDQTSWNEVSNRIPKEQFDVLTLNRDGRDTVHPASLKEIATLGCAKTPVSSILVAHSYGGAIATAMFGLCPEKIVKIIYVSAVVPMNTEKPFDRMKDKRAQKTYAKAVTFDSKMIYPRESMVFYKVMDPSVNLHSLWLPALFPESMNLTMEPLQYDQEKFWALAKSYVITEKDPVVSLQSQQMFIKDARITQTEGVATGHFPMISNPEALTRVILLQAAVK
jgi:pimeloyl-ACP methyl ester carboxylesterase